MVYKSTTPIDLEQAVNSPAMSDHLVRVDNLRRIQAERGWNDADLARQTGRQPQQLRSWWAYPGKNGRQIGEKLARSLEEELKLPRYSLDERPAPRAKLPTREGSQGYIPTTTFEARASAAQQVGTTVPVLTWEQLSQMLMEPNAAISDATPRLDTFATHSTAAKFVAMPDDSMEPVYSAGDHILFDPAEAPRAGDTVLVRLASGEHLVRVFKPKTAHQWEASPINGNYQPLSSSEEAATVVAVMVEHRRYRQRR
jgi:SOS-response transcriptional repressor LexA